MGYPIRAALTANPLTKPLLDGTVRIPGFDWTAEVLDPAELFLRQLHGDEFDVFEMSLSTHLRVCSLRQDRWIALPVFTSRKLAHLEILVTERSGISGPSELRGRRIGVPEYQQTSAVWSRGVLEHDFCVRPSEIDWVMERGAERSHGAATEFVPPPGVRISPVDENESLGSLLLAGRIDGALRYIGKRNLVDRSPSLTHAQLGVRPLFDREAERERLRGRPLHANHCVAVRRELADDVPEILPAVMAGFSEARRRSAAASLAEMPYGFAANEAMLRALADQAFEQGITVARVDPRDVFADPPVPGDGDRAD